MWKRTLRKYQRIFQEAMRNKTELKMEKDVQITIEYLSIDSS